MSYLRWFALSHLRQIDRCCYRDPTRLSFVRMDDGYSVNIYSEFIQTYAVKFAWHAQSACRINSMETPMRIASFLAATVVAIGLSASGSPSQATSFPSSTLHQLQTSQSLAQPVGYRRHCVRWRHICGRRWGWGGPRFRRCMIRHRC
jgi:hypothetical protein